MYKFFVMLLLVLILLSTCMGCAIMVAKETAKVVDIVLEDDPNPSKKEKILKKQNDKKESHRNKAKEFFCEKVEDHPKCDD